MVNGFKDGDIIEPANKGEGASFWYGMRILKWFPDTKTADVKDADGDIIYDFNLNPAIGVIFKCVNH